jgi:hypothetical protein
MCQGPSQSRLKVSRLIDPFAKRTQRPRDAGIVATQCDADLVSFEPVVQRFTASAETLVI